MKRKLIVLGFCVMLLILFIQIAFALKTEKPNAAERLQAKIQAMDPKNEMVDLRTLNRRTFKKKDGKMITFIASEPLNYLEDDNRLYPIDINVTSEKPANANKTGKSNEPNKYRHHVLKNSIKARFTDESNGGVQLEYQKHSIEFVLDHKNKRQATVDKNKIRFNKVFNNGDLIYTILPGQVKDELIFSSPPKTPVISYKLKMSQKLTPQNGPKGSILLVDNTGKAVFELLPAFMFEKDNTSQCKDVETKFHWNKNELYCDMILDMSWLKDKKRHYPIVVDPIVSPAPTSSGKTENRTLIHCPEDWGTITCEIDLDGPGWHGNLASHSKSEVYFRDNMTGTKFLNYHDLNEYHPDPCTINIQAGHDYEVYLYGGKAHHIFAGNYTG
ncbi:MAG TPA: hypothetical protein VHY08_09815, partial [Bacillota bacterium]|nr:hypothetical protein [Bacillota bacterium]